MEVPKNTLAQNTIYDITAKITFGIKDQRKKGEVTTEIQTPIEITEGIFTVLPLNAIPLQTDCSIVIDEFTYDEDMSFDVLVEYYTKNGDMIKRREVVYA